VTWSSTIVTALAYVRHDPRCPYYALSDDERHDVDTCVCHCERRERLTWLRKVLKEAAK